MGAVINLLFSGQLEGFILGLALMAIAGVAFYLMLDRPKDKR